MGRSFQCDRFTSSSLKPPQLKPRLYRLIVQARQQLQGLGIVPRDHLDDPGRADASVPYITCGIPSLVVQDIADFSLEAGRRVRINLDFHFLIPEDGP